MDYSFYLPYYMIIVSSYTHDFQLGLKMYLLIFEKKAYSSDWWMNNLIWNFRFYLPHSESTFIDKFKDYLLFIEQNNTYRFDKDVLSEYGIKNSNKCTLKEASNKILIYTGFMDYLWNDTYIQNNPIGGAEKAV